MEIVTSLYLQQPCQLLLWCCFSLLTLFFLQRVFAWRLVICRTSRMGIEKCAAKLFQTHGGSDNESPKLSLAGNTFLIPSTAWALLILCPRPPAALSSGCQGQERRTILQFLGILGFVLSTDWPPPNSWITPLFPGGAGVVRSVCGKDKLFPVREAVMLPPINKISTPLAFDWGTTYTWLHCMC